MQNVLADAGEVLGTGAAVEVEQAEQGGGVAAAQGDGGDAADGVENNAVAAKRGLAAGVGDDEVVAGAGGVADDGV